jgi:hypothetical protein
VSELVALNTRLFVPQPRPPAPFGVVDPDWEAAALVIMCVEQRELLMSVDDVRGIVKCASQRRQLTFFGGSVMASLTALLDGLAS